MKLLTVLGARPQFVKASVVSMALKRRGVLETIVHTGQHFDPNMSDVFFDELGIAPPAHHLDVNGGGHAEMTGRMMIGLEPLVERVKPDAVLVYGDTNSTLAGTLVAAKLHLPVAHVEAGLRSHNLRMPEEINRIVTDRLSRWLFVPTPLAASHLRDEGVDSGRIHLVGDVMLDVAIQHGQRAAELGPGVLATEGLEGAHYALATIHRAENTNEPARLGQIVQALERVALHMRVVWPLHPRTRAILAREGLLERCVRAMTLLEPQGYLDMVRLETSAAVIATDSGGVQKEAFFHRVPCVTLRDETEWMELVESGWNTLVPPRDSHSMADAILTAVGTTGREIEPYGRGDASERIARVLLDASVDAGPLASVVRLPA